MTDWRDLFMRGKELCGDFSVFYCDQNPDAWRQWKDERDGLKRETFLRGNPYEVGDETTEPNWRHLYANLFSLIRSLDFHMPEPTYDSWREDYIQLMQAAHQTLANLEKGDVW